MITLLDEENARRETDKGAIAVTKVASRTLWGWVERHHIDALAVLIITLWITVKVVDWAMDFADSHYDVDGMQIAAIIGAVLTPWGLSQSAMFAFYVNLKAKNGAKP